MSVALGLVSSNSKFYFTWYDEFKGGCSSDYYQFSYKLMTQLKNGRNLSEAIQTACDEYGGFNGQHPEDEWRLMGQRTPWDFRIR